MRAYKKNQRAKTTTDRREYHIVCCIGFTKYDDGDYNEYYPSKRLTSGSCDYWKKRINHFQYRMYRTWKYNRKTQYKIK